MPNCLQVMDQSGQLGDDVRAFKTPETPTELCYGDFIKANTVDGCREYARISTVAWNASLLQTQKDAKVAFEGVSLMEVDTDVCSDPAPCIPYDNYVVPSKFRRSYTIVNEAGAPTPASFVRGQGFTFGKNPDEDLLSNNTIQMTSDADAIVFRAVGDSCGAELAMAMVEFAD